MTHPTLLVSVLALLVAGPFQATAQPTPARALVFPPFRPGETISFSSRTTRHNETPGQPVDIETTKIFDVQVLQVTAAGALVRWTLRSWTETDNQPSLEKLRMATFKGVPIDLRLDPSGQPVEVVNWAVTRKRMMAAVPGGKDWSVEGMTPEHDRMAMFVIMTGLTGDLVTMAAVQGHDPILPGRTNLQGVDLPPPSVEPPPADVHLHVTRTVELQGVDAPHCSAQIKLSSIQTLNIGAHAASPQLLDTSASVSTADRWVVSLHDTLSVQPRFLRTTDITRLSPAPCP
jgi:hypothetical protein